VSYPLGLYSTGMHDWILDEALLGVRVAHGLDSENNGGWSALMDLSYAEYVRAEQALDDVVRVDDRSGLDGSVGVRM